MSKISEEEQILNALERFQFDYENAVNKEDLPNTIDQNKLWKTVLKLASLPNQLYAQHFPLFSFYNNVFPSFSENNPALVVQQIENLKKTKNMQNLSNSIKPYIRVIPFLEIEHIFSLFEISIKIISYNLKIREDQIPMDFVSVFDDVIIEDLNRKTFDIIVDYFKKMIDTEQKAQVIIIFAFFALTFVKVDEHIDTFVKDTIKDALDSSESITIIAGFHLLSEFSPHYQFDAQSAPEKDFLIDKIFSSLTSDNNNLSKYAHEAAEAMIKCRIFQENYAMNRIFDMFDSYPLSSIDSFFSLLHIIIYPVNDYQEIDYKPQMNNLIPIRTFVVDKLQNSQEPIIKAHCINVISDLMSIKKSFVQKYNSIAYEEAKNLISHRKFVTYHLISSFIDAIYINYEQFRLEIANPKSKNDLVEQLSNAISNDKLNKKQKLDLAIDLSSICRRANKQPPENLKMFSSSSIGSKNLSESLQAIAVVDNLMPFYGKQAIKKIFEKTSQGINELADVKLINYYVGLLIKLFVYYKGDLLMARKNLNKILSNPFLLHTERNEATECTRYVCTIIKYYPDFAPNMFELFANLITKSEIPACGFFLPVIAAIQTKKVPQEEIHKLCEEILEIIKKEELTHIYKSVNAAIEVLDTVFNEIPEALNPIDKFVKDVGGLMENFDTNELESPAMQNLIQKAPTICNFVLDVYANYLEIDINEDLFTTIINLLPFPAEVKYTELILKNLMKIILMDKFEEWKIDVCRVFAAYLLLNKNDLNEFKFDPKTIEQMVFLLKKVTSENPQNFDKILEHFQNLNRDEPKLRKLIQE